MSTFIDGLPGDGPKPGGGRHQWLLKQAVRLACGWRLGCVTEADHRRAGELLGRRLAELRAATGERVGRFEIGGAFEFGAEAAAAKTEVEARAELGDHPHHDAATQLDAPTSLVDQRAVSGTWLGAQQFAPLEYQVDGIVPEGLGLLAAPPKKGKSFLVADFGLAVASGGRALGALPTTARPVLYLALEDGHRRLQNRFHRILDGQPFPAGIELIIKASPHEAIGMIAEFFGRHADEKPLVILDTFGKARPPKRVGEDSYQADYAVGTALKNLVDAAPGATLLVVHHTRKAEVLDFVDSVSGTQGIAGSVDFVLVLERKRHSDDAVLSVTGRDIPEAEYALTAQYGILWRLDGKTLTEARHRVDERRETSGLGDRQSGLLEFVNGRVHTSAADAAAKLGATPKLAAMALRDLYDRGRIRRVQRGVYGPNTPESPESPESAGQNVFPFPTPLPKVPNDNLK